MITGIRQTPIPMNTKQQQKLNGVIARGFESRSGLKDFEIDFEKFSTIVLRRSVELINEQLQLAQSSDMLKIFFENPYAITTTRFFVMVQLFPTYTSSFQGLNHSAANPSLIFEGNQFSKKVKVSQRSNSLYKDVQDKTWPLEELLHSEKVVDLLIEFLENAYTA
jgi:hypothetical protein